MSTTLSIGMVTATAVLDPLGVVHTNEKTMNMSMQSEIFMAILTGDGVEIGLEDVTWLAECKGDGGVEKRRSECAAGKEGSHKQDSRLK